MDRFARRCDSPGRAGRSCAWNSTGHRTVAYIAFQQLDDATRQRVAAAFAKHPAIQTDLWKKFGTANDDPIKKLFMNAATFPDDVRFSQFQPNTRFHDPSFKPFHKKFAHFIDFQYRPPSDKPGLPVTNEPMTLLNTYQDNVTLVRDPNADDTNQAVALSWIFHQVGDVHQPLHATSRFAGNHLNDGDEGGTT